MAIKDVNVGDVFLNSWGYDQTNTDFYQVVRVTKASVFLQKIAYEVVNETSWGSYEVRPVKDSFDTEQKPIMKRINRSPNGNIYLTFKCGSCGRVNLTDLHHMSTYA